MAKSEPEQAEGQPQLTLGEMKKRLAEARAARRTYEAGWFMNLAFFQGEHWVAWNGNALYRPAMKGRLTITDNRIRPAVLTEVARLSKQRPSWACTPRQVSDQAATDAQAANRLLEWAWDSMNLSRVRREAQLWSRICGAGFVKTCWDPQASPGVEAVIGPNGVPVNHPTTGSPLLRGEMPELETMEGVSFKAIGGGEVVHHVRSPFNVFVDPLATKIEDARYLIDEVVRSPEYVKTRYFKDVAPDAAAGVGVVESRFHRQGLDANSGPKMGVRVYEMWEPESASLPEGRRTVWTDGLVLYQGPNEYKRIPYTIFEGIPVPGRFWPDAIVTDMRPLNVRHNKLLSQIAENAGRTANPALLLDQLSNLKVYGVPGEQIKHNAVTQTQLPQYLVPPSMPAYTQWLLDFFGQSMRETSGQYEVSSGGVPAGVTAASAISQLTEQSDTRLGPDVEAHELSIADIGQQSLDLMATYYTTERIIVIAGQDGIVDVDTFKADIGYEKPVVSVVPMSTFPRSLAAKQAAIRDTLNMFFQYGVPIDAASLPYILRDMQVGGLDRLVSAYTADVNQIAREHVALVRGADLPVRLTDNDAVHIAGHSDFAKTARFQNLPEEQQAALMLHITQHQANATTKQPPPPVPQIVGTPPPGAPAPLLPDAGDVPTDPSGNALPEQIDAGSSL